MCSFYSLRFLKICQKTLLLRPLEPAISRPECLSNSPSGIYHEARRSPLFTGQFRKPATKSSEFPQVNTPSIHETTQPRESRNPQNPVETDQSLVLREAQNLTLLDVAREVKPGWFGQKNSMSSWGDAVHDRTETRHRRKCNRPSNQCVLQDVPAPEIGLQTTPRKANSSQRFTKSAAYSAGFVPTYISASIARQFDQSTDTPAELSRFQVSITRVEPVDRF